MSVSAKEVKSWYDLCLSILDRLRGSPNAMRQARLERYEGLFQTIRFIHVDYVEMFQAFIDDIHMSNEQTVARAKKAFLSARKRHSSQRCITKLDADTYIRMTDEFVEQRFLTAVALYFHYSIDENFLARRLGAVDAELFAALPPERTELSWRSASMEFWDKIENVRGEYELQEIAIGALSALEKRFQMIVMTYTQLEQNWTFSLPIVETSVSRAMRKVEMI